MAAVIGALRVDLGANTAQFVQGMTRAQAQARRTGQDIRRSFAEAQRGSSTAFTEMTRSANLVRNTLRNLAGTIAAAFTARELINLIDTFTRFQNSLRVAGIEGADMVSVQNSLFASAQRYGVELETLGTLFSRASQAASALGASQQDLLSFTNNIAAAVRVQGGSVEQASGALLQLAQALQSGTVRAEEFNSVNEGLFPVLQAVAQGSDRFQGSVARLRAEVIAGRVSSREFFDAFQRGAATLQERAAKSALTTTAAFTQLRNALVVYFGEANQASGASAALGTAIRTLADNLNTLIPALATLGIALGVGFVTRAVAARIAAMGATTAIAGLATAGRGLLAVFGGPVGIAITGVALALTSLAGNAAEAEAAAARLTGGLDQAQLKFDEARDRATRAGIAVRTMSVESAAASPVMMALAQALNVASAAAADYARTARAAAIASAQLRLAQARTDVRRLQQLQGARSRPGPTFGLFNAFGPSNAEVQAGIAAGRAQIRLTEQEVQILAQTPESAFPRAGAAPAAGRTGGRSRSGGANDAERLREQGLRDEHEFQSELRRYRAETLRAQQDQLTDTVARSQIDEELLDIERDQYVSDLNLKVALKDLEQTRATQLLAAFDTAQEERRQAITLQRTREVASENREIAEERHAIATEALQHEAAMSSTAAERRDAEMRLLDLAYRHERARLQEIIADESSSRVAVEKARLREAELNNWRTRETQSINRSTMGPLETFLDQLPTTAEKANEALQKVAVEGLQSIEDGLVAALMGTKSLAAAFRDMASSIIADLIRIQIQRMITIPLSNALSSILGVGLSAAGAAAGASSAFAGGSAVSSGVSSTISALIPRARGGPVIPGGSYLVGENGPEHLFMGARGGMVRPINDNGRLNGPTFNIYTTTPNSGDPRRDRRSSMQHSAILRDEIARASRTGH